MGTEQRISDIQSDAMVVEIVPATAKSRWILSRNRICLPASRAGTVDFAILSGNDGAFELRPVSSLGDAELSLPLSRCRFARINTTSTSIDLTFSKVFVDGGFGWDVHFPVCIQIDKPDVFLSEVQGFLQLDRGLSADFVASLLHQRLEPRIREPEKGRSLQQLGQSIKRLRDEAALPAKWWEGRFGEWLAEVGVKLHLRGGPCWSSADAVAAEREAERGRRLADITKQRSLIQEARAKRQAEDLRYRQELAQIESSRAGAERERELQQLEYRHRLELLTRESEAAKAKLELQQQLLALESALAKARGDAEAAAKITEQQQVLEQTIGRLASELKTNSQAFTDFVKRLPEVFAQLAGPNGEAARQAADTAVWKQEFPVGLLRQIGLGSARHETVEYFKRNAGRGGVAISKTDILTRDIGAVRKQPTVRLGQRLDFSITTSRGGFLTLINLGTSGRFWLMLPNSECKPLSCRVDAGQRYAIPGERFLTNWELEENGPPDRYEAILAIVSDEPPIDAELLASGTSDGPILKLSPETLAVATELLEATPDTWSCAVLQFYVIA